MQLDRGQQKLVEDNMGLVGLVIRDNVNDANHLGMFTYDDIFQIGCIGLSKAALNHKPERSRFSSYAYAAIRNEIYDALDYAYYRQRRESPTDACDVLYMEPVWDEYDGTVSEIEELLDKAKAGAGGIVAKGIEAIRMMADGYTAREIGERMGGVPPNNVTAWVSKARRLLRVNPAINAMR